MVLEQSQAGSPIEPTDAVIAGAISSERRSIRRQTQVVDLVGALILAVVVPTLVSQWAPTAAAVAWGVLFVLVSAIGACHRNIALIARVQVPIFIGGLTLLWVSVPFLVWPAIDVALTAVVVLCLIILAIHALNLSLAADGGWYLPSLGFGLTVMTVALVQGAWAHALLVGVFSTFVILGGSNSDAVFRRQVRATVLERFHRSRFEYEALHDALTSLPNRRAADLWLGRHAGKTITVAAIDFDDFKRVNETWDHQVGDVALVAVAEGLVRSFEGWTVFRFGGDEFLAFTTGDAVPETLGPFEATATFKGRDVTFEVSVSCGIAVGDPGERNLWAEAEFALSRAKRTKGCIGRLTAELRDRYEMLHQLGLDLDEALARDEIEAYAQPIVDAQDHSVLGYELLARWHHPTYGFLLPEVFLPAVETSGKHEELAAHMLDRAAAFLGRTDLGPEHGWIAVNIEPATFCRGDFADLVFSVFSEHGAPLDRLCVEITERGQLYRSERFERSAARLHDAGVILALDDFGSGQVALRDTGRVPANYKFDDEMVMDPTLTELVGAVARYAASIGSMVVAEGIDTQDKADRMKAAGVQALQGYLFGEPAPLADLAIVGDARRDVEIPASIS